MSDFISPDGPVIARGLLDKADLQSQAWHKLSTHLEAQLMTLRRRNDNPDLDPLATAALRGEIKAITNLLALGTQDLANAANEDGPE